MLFLILKKLSVSWAQLLMESCSLEENSSDEAQRLPSQHLASQRTRARKAAEPK